MAEPTDFERKRIELDKRRAMIAADRVSAILPLLPLENLELVRLLLDAYVLADADEAARLTDAILPGADHDTVAALAADVLARHGGPEAARAKFDELRGKNHATADDPDFNQTARQFFVDYRGDPIPALSEQLRLIWNARGAADIAELDHTLSTGLEPSMKVINQILRALDR